MKILVAHLGSNWVNMCGGVERVTCSLANALVARGHEVSIIYRDWCEGEPYFPLDQRVKQYNILLKTEVRLFQKGCLIIFEFCGKRPGSSVKRQRRGLMLNIKEGNMDRLYVRS